MAVKRIVYNKCTYSISYEIVNPSASHDLIILHGWGSNKEIMKQAFGKFSKDFRHIYIDLPGFGASTNDTELNTQEYAHIIDAFIENLGAKKDVILGHSFGGKVATLLNPKLLVLVASAGILLPKPLSIKLKIAMFKLFKPFGITKLRKLFVAQDAQELSHAMYETFKTVVNEDFSPQFKAYQGKAFLCYGTEDTATPVLAGEQIDNLISNSLLNIYSGDHFFFMKEASNIAKEIDQQFQDLIGN